jgi:hypothetical protein
MLIVALSASEASSCEMFVRNKPDVIAVLGCGHASLKRLTGRK